MFALKIKIFSLYTVVRRRAVASTLVKVIALLRRRADAATIAAEGCAAALGLALVILKHEEGIGARLELRALERLIGGRVAPL
jgi:hypothetical protein